MNETLDTTVLIPERMDACTDSPRVAWVASASTCLRLGRMLGPLAVGLTDQGVELVGVCGDDAPVRTFVDWPMDVIRFFMRRWFRPARAISRLAEDLRQRDVQLLHALDAEAGHTTSLLAAKLDCQHVVSSYSLGDGRLIGRMGVRPAMVLAAGQAVQDDLINRHCIPSDRVTIVPPAVHQVPHASVARQPDRCSSIVTSDIFDDYGATAAVLEAFAKLKSAGTDCHFFAVGNGPAEHVLRKYSEKLGLCSSLTFVDRLDSKQLAGVFKGADIYISPRGASSINIDALLAMGSGATVLAPEDHVSDFLIDGRTAQMFRSRDARDIADRLGELLSNGEKSASLAAGALDYLDDNHRPRRAVQSASRVYRKLLSARKHHANVSV
jgi:glycosyltransferase involved in cell wall biosynthesis